jgi:2,4-dienoyl-CoA reductase-like NADH-dependent reductase (Old Yellow Enzyme family)
MSQLFTPFKLRGVEFKNRIFVSPMCQYSSQDGMPTDWHLVHLGSRAVGGAALVIAEATAVSPEGRITPDDSGLWSDEHARGFERITRFMHEEGALAGIQLAHAGRKASTDAPWRGGRALGPNERGWTPLSPSAIAFSENSPVPRAMSSEEIDQVVRDFERGARLALSAGFDVIELHLAHGYLVHEFLSPLSNHRQDEYGGSLQNRIRLALRIARATRAIWPKERPVFARISATDWVQGGWDLAQSIALCRELRTLGVDLIDVSSGGSVPQATIPNTPGYQVPFAAAIRREAGIATGAVGLITEPEQADAIITGGEADVVLLARAMLRDPYWALHAAQKLRTPVSWPEQYQRAAPREIE